MPWPGVLRYVREGDCCSSFRWRIGRWFGPSWANKHLPFQKSVYHLHSISTPGKDYLGDNIPNLFFHLLFRAFKPLPQVITHTTTLQKHSQCSLLATQLQHTIDIFRCASQERGFQDRIGHGGRLLLFTVGVFRRLQMEQGVIDVSLKMRREPWLKGECFLCTLQSH